MDAHRTVTEERNAMKTEVERLLTSDPTQVKRTVWRCPFCAGTGNRDQEMEPIMFPVEREGPACGECEGDGFLEYMPQGYGTPQWFEGTLEECHRWVKRPAPQMSGLRTSAGSEPAYAMQYLRGEDSGSQPEAGSSQTVSGHFDPPEFCLPDPNAPVEDLLEGLENSLRTGGHGFALEHLRKIREHIAEQRDALGTSTVIAMCLTCEDRHTHSDEEGCCLVCGDALLGLYGEYSADLLEEHLANRKSEMEKTSAETEKLRADLSEAVDSEKAAIISWLESRRESDPDNTNIFERLIFGLREDEHDPWRTP